MGKKGRFVQRGAWRPRPGPGDFSSPSHNQRGWGGSPGGAPYGGNGSPAGMSPPMRPNQQFQQGNGFRPHPQQGYGQQHHQPQYGGWAGPRRGGPRPGPSQFSNRPPTQPYQSQGFGNNPSDDSSYAESSYSSNFQSHRSHSTTLPGDLPRDRDLRTALPDVLQALGASLSTPPLVTAPSKQAEINPAYEPSKGDSVTPKHPGSFDPNTTASGPGQNSESVHGGPFTSSAPGSMRRRSITSSRSRSSTRDSPDHQDGPSNHSDDPPTLAQRPFASKQANSITHSVERPAEGEVQKAVLPPRSPTAYEKGKQREQPEKAEASKSTPDTAQEKKGVPAMNAARQEKAGRKSPELKTLEDKFDLWSVPPDIDVRPRERDSYRAKDRDRDFRGSRRDHDDDDRYGRARGRASSDRGSERSRSTSRYGRDDRRRRRSISSDSYTSDERHRLRLRHRASVSRSPTLTPPPRSPPRGPRRDGFGRERYPRNDENSRRYDDSRRGYESRRANDDVRRDSGPSSDVARGVDATRRTDRDARLARDDGYRSISPVATRSARGDPSRHDHPRNARDDRRESRVERDGKRKDEHRRYEAGRDAGDRRSERRRSRSPARSDMAGRTSTAARVANPQDRHGDRRVVNDVDDWRADLRKSRKEDGISPPRQPRSASPTRSRSPTRDQVLQPPANGGRILARKSPIITKASLSPAPQPRPGGWTVVSDHSKGNDRSKSPRDDPRLVHHRVPAGQSVSPNTPREASPDSEVSPRDRPSPAPRPVPRNHALTENSVIPRFVPRPREHASGVASDQWQRTSSGRRDDHTGRRDDHARRADEPHGSRNKKKRKQPQQQQQQQQHQQQQQQHHHQQQQRQMSPRQVEISRREDAIVPAPSAAMLAAMAAAAGDVGDPSILSAIGVPLPHEANESDAPARYSSPPRAGLGEGYTRIALVGEGTYGLVYKARAETSGVLVALKKIRMEAEKDGFPVTAIREVKLLQSLRHPNIVRLHEMMMSKGSVYMVFEYMQHDLNGVISQPDIHFTPAHLKSLALQLLQGLDFLHRKSILHRDLKGSNILLDNTGTLKLADFGLARYYLKRRDGDYTNRVVTLWYRPPELLFGATKYGPEIDMWGAGCIFLELFTRRTPFPGNDEIHQVQVIMDLMGPVTTEAWPEVESLPWFDLVRPIEAEPEDTEMDGEPLEKVESKFIETYGSRLSPGAIAVAQALLLYDPRKRVSAADALTMAYFDEELPPPEAPAGLLSSLEGEWHEYESRKARKARQADASVDKSKGGA